MTNTNTTEIKWLEKSPMYQMSLGSRKLFHSNFLAWLFEAYSDSIEILGIEPSKFKGVLREKKNVDLVILGENDEILAILENKIKDIPRQGQLERYAKFFANTKKGILLTLVPESFDLSQTKGGSDWGWTRLSYRELARNIEAWRIRAKLEHRDSMFVDEYCMMVNKICDIAEKHLNPDIIEKRYWFPISDRESLAAIRFDDTVKKHEAQLMASELEKRIQNELGKRLFEEGEETENGRITAFVGGALYNKTPCVTAGIVRDGSSKVCLMTQIQGHQYRRMISSSNFNFAKKSGSGDRYSSLQKCIDESDEFTWLFASEQSPDGFRVQQWENPGPFKSSMRNKLNGYAPDAVYQYIDISKGPVSQGELSYNMVLKNVVSDMKYAIETLKRSDYVSTS